VDLVIARGEVPDNHMRTFARVMEMNGPIFISYEKICQDVPEAKKSYPYQTTYFEELVDKHRHEAICGRVLSGYLKDEYGFTPFKDPIHIVDSLDTSQATPEKNRHFLNMFQYIGHIAIWDFIPIDVQRLKPAHIIQIIQGKFTHSLIDQVLSPDKNEQETVIDRTIEFGPEIVLRETRKRDTGIKVSEIMQPKTVVTTYEKALAPYLTEVALGRLREIDERRLRAFDEDKDWYDYGLEFDDRRFIGEKLMVYDSLG